MGMAIAPMIGPAIGGYIDSVAGWRWSFALLGAFGAIALISTWVSLPETNTFAGQSASDQKRAYKIILTMPLFWLYVASASLASAVFFGFLGGGPAVSSVYFEQTPFEYGLYFSLCAIGYATGNGIAGKYSETVGVSKMMSVGALVTLLGPLLSLCLFVVYADPAPWMLFVPLSLVGLGNGMTLPNVTAATISLKPEVAGAASGMLGTLQIGGGAVASVIGAIVVGESGSPIALCLLLTGFGIAALIATLEAARQS
jgi:DHA1 family bicyclomycin/chloramphenicol resistance-like MFS transporter